jgi:hypothetical protein
MKDLIDRHKQESYELGLEHGKELERVNILSKLKNFDHPASRPWGSEDQIVVEVVQAIRKLINKQL